MSLTSDPPGGFATTLHAKDLPRLVEALATPFTPLPFARVGFDEAAFRRTLAALPHGSSTATVVEALHYVSALPGRLRYHDAELNMGGAYDLVDRFVGDLPTAERVVQLHSPVPWRDGFVVPFVKEFLRQNREYGKVGLMSALTNVGGNMIGALEAVERAMHKEKERGDGRVDLVLRRRVAHTVQDLESLHRAVVVYIWTGFRLPVVYADYDVAEPLKRRVEVAMQWVLEGISMAGGGDGKVARQKSWKEVVGEKDWEVESGGAEHTQRHLAQRAEPSRPYIPSASRVAMKGAGAQRVARIVAERGKGGSSNEGSETKKAE